MMLSLDLWQDVVVTAIAFGCGALVVRRVLGLVQPLKKTGCANCASSKDACVTPQVNGTSAPISVASIRRSGP